MPASQGFKLQLSSLEPLPKEPNPIVPVREPKTNFERAEVGAALAVGGGGVCLSLRCVKARSKPPPPKPPPPVQPGWQLDCTSCKQIILVDLSGKQGAVGAPLSVTCPKCSSVMRFLTAAPSPAKKVNPQTVTLSRRAAPPLRSPLRTFTPRLLHVACR